MGRLSDEVSTNELVSDVQFEILKLISEKEDLEKENEVLRQYRQSYIEIVAENNFLREKLELVEMSRERRQGSRLLATVRSRQDPEGQEDLKIRKF